MTAAILNALKYVPASVGIKALEKLDPRFKSYFAKVAANGLDTNRALDYVTEKLSNPNTATFKNQLEQKAQQRSLLPEEQAIRSDLANQSQPGMIARGLASFGGAGLANLGGGVSEGQEDQTAQPAAQNQASNVDPFQILAQHDPELAKFIEEHINQGKTPEQAAATATVHPKHGKTAKKIEKAVKKGFVDYVTSLFGETTQPLQPQQATAGQPTANTASQAQPGQQQGGFDDAAIIQAIQNIFKM